MKIYILRIICFIALTVTTLKGYGQASPQERSFNSGLEIIENKGQFQPEIIGVVKVPGGEVMISGDGLYYHFYDAKTVAEAHHHPEKAPENINFHSVKVNYIGANTKPSEVKWGVPNPSFKNYFIGNDPKRWASEVKSYQDLIIRNIYTGVDARYYIQNGSLKYEFLLAKGIDPNIIQLDFQGAEQLRISRDGDLIIKTSVNEWVEKKPVSYQKNNLGDLEEIKSKYKLSGNRLSFSFPKDVNPNEALIIDPFLIFSGYSGSPVDNFGYTATYDAQGNLYGGGNAYNIATSSYPRTPGAYTQPIGLLEDIGITKFQSQGNSVLYSTYIGGNSFDVPISLVVDAANNLIILGKTLSTNFPTSANAYDLTHNGEFDLTITKLNPTGSNLLASTYLGGADQDGHNINSAAGQAQFYLQDIATLNFNYGDAARGEVIIDSANNIYITSNTRSTNFPVTANAAQNLKGAAQDGFLVKFNSTLTTLLYSTFHGGDGNDAGYSIQLDSSLNIYLAGGTQSTNLAATANRYQATYGGDRDGFLAKYSPSGVLLAQTYVGTGSYDQCFFVQIGPDNQPYVLGQSLGNMPVSANVYSVTNGKQFIMKFNENLTASTMSTVFGKGNGLIDISPTAFLVDRCGKIYVSGWGGATNNNGIAPFGNLLNMPVTPDAYQLTTNDPTGSDFYLIVLDRDATALVYATLMGGNVSREHVDGGTSRFDKQGIVYQAICGGCLGNSDFPINQPAGSTISQTNNSTNCNLTVFKFDFQAQNVVARFDTTSAGLNVNGCDPFTYQFQNLSTNNANYFWFFGDGVTSNLISPAHTYPFPDTFQVTLIVTDTTPFCPSEDTAFATVIVNPKPIISIDTIGAICPNDTTLLNATSTVPIANWQWAANPTLINDTIATPTIFPGGNTTYTVIGTSQFGCSDTASILVETLFLPDLISMAPPTICKGDSIQLFSTAIAASLDTIWWDAQQGITDLTNLNPFVRPQTTTTYVLRGLTAQGCEVEDSITVNVVVTVQSDLDSLYFICPNDSVTLFANPNGTSFLWSTGDTTETIRVTTDSAAIYWVVVNIGVCESNRDTSVVLVDFVDPLFEVMPDTGYAPQIAQMVNLTGSANTWIWTFGNGSGSNQFNPSTFYPQPGIYPIELIAINSITGCIDTFRLDYFVDTVGITLPSAFTPKNLDGKNDFFRSAYLNMASVNIKIFNRWGALIYESNDLDFEWDGTFNGEPVPVGTYPYLLSGYGKNERWYSLKGSVSVIR